MFTRLKSWLNRESPLERYIRHLEEQNAALVKQSAALLDKVLAREGFAPIAEEAAPPPATVAQPHPFEDDETIREADEAAEIEEKAQLASRDEDFMQQVEWHVNVEGDRRWEPVLKRAEELMERSH